MAVSSRSWPPTGTINTHPNATQAASTGGGGWGVVPTGPHGLKENQAGNDPRQRDPKLRGGPAAHELSRRTPSAVTTKPLGCASVQSVCTELLLCAKPCPQEVGFGVGPDGQHAWLSSSSSAWTGAKPSRLKEPQTGGSSAGFCDSAEQPLSAPFTEARTPNNSPEQCLRGMVFDEGGDEREWLPSRERA